MDIEFLRKNYRDQILAIAETCNVENVRVFGSVARGEARSDSDIDFLVHIRPDSGLGILGMRWRLEELLNTKVDVLLDEGLNLRIKNIILNEAVLL
jgi:predicted nucleotidyltransferase